MRAHKRWSVLPDPAGGQAWLVADESLASDLEGRRQLGVVTRRHEVVGLETEVVHQCEEVVLPRLRVPGRQLPGSFPGVDPAPEE